MLDSPVATSSKATYTSVVNAPEASFLSVPSIKALAPSTEFQILHVKVLLSSAKLVN